jgi:3-deoxy-D-manno-octulosonic-acid transferase
LRKSCLGPFRHSVAAVGAALALPPSLVALALRPAWRERLGERLGRTAVAPTGGVWIHGASVGEAQVTARLAKRLRDQGVTVTTSCTTLTGRAALSRAIPDLAHSLAPLDHPWCVAAALARRRPSSLVLIETELWPSLIAGCDRRGVPTVILSGRISDRAHRRYLAARPLLAPTLRRVARVGARTEEDAERFVSLGAEPWRVRVTGDLKLGPPSAPPELAGELRRAFEAVPLFVAGSTHAGEEAAALGALARCEAAGIDCALVLAPRDLSRVPHVAAEVERAGRVLHRRSRLAERPLQSGEVLLLDTLGELAGVYGLAKLAFVGGTLASVGGHNLLEPVQQGTPVCFGPHVANVREAANLLSASGAGLAVVDAAGLAMTVAEAMCDPELESRGVAGHRALASHQGGLDRSLALLAEVVPGLRV